MDMRRLVGRNVRRIRLEKNLTQEQFAERSGFTQQYLSDLERGQRNPTIVSLYELAQALDVEHVALVALDDEAMAEKARRRKREPKSAQSKSDRGKAAKPTMRKGAKSARRKT
jgi:transcriptional regulator with XRE-family HTH domain